MAIEVSLRRKIIQSEMLQFVPIVTAGALVILGGNDMTNGSKDNLITATEEYPPVVSDTEKNEINTIKSNLFDHAAMMARQNGSGNISIEITREQGIVIARLNDLEYANSQRELNIKNRAAELSQQDRSVNLNPENFSLGRIPRGALETLGGFVITAVLMKKRFF